MCENLQRIWGIVYWVNVLLVKAADVRTWFADFSYHLLEQLHFYDVIHLYLDDFYLHNDPLITLHKQILGHDIEDLFLPQECFGGMNAESCVMKSNW